MKKVEDYLGHASECRELAKRANGPEEREMLLNMAETWEAMARSREETLRRRERIARLDPKLA